MELFGQSVLQGVFGLRNYGSRKMGCQKLARYSGLKLIARITYAAIVLLLIYCSECWFEVQSVAWRNLALGWIPMFLFGAAREIWLFVAEGCADGRKEREVIEGNFLE
jgi:hypothetical protein